MWAKTVSTLVGSCTSVTFLRSSTNFRLNVPFHPSRCVQGVEVKGSELSGNRSLVIPGIHQTQKVKIDDVLYFFLADFSCFVIRGVTGMSVHNITSLAVCVL